MWLNHKGLAGPNRVKKIRSNKMFIKNEALSMSLPDIKKNLMDGVFQLELVIVV